MIQLHIDYVSKDNFWIDIVMLCSNFGEITKWFAIWYHEISIMILIECYDTEGYYYHNWVVIGIEAT